MAAPRGTKTTLQVGVIQAPVALYKTTDKRDRQSFIEAGPNGHPLQRQQRLVNSQIGKQDLSDPLGTREAAEEIKEAQMKALADSLDTTPDKVKIPEPLADVETETVIVEEQTGEVVKPEDVRRGLHDELNDTFIDLTDDLAKIDEQTKLDRMVIDCFVRTESVPRERVVGSYFVGFDGPGSKKVLDVLRLALKEKGRVGVVKWTKTSRQALGVIIPRRKGLALIELAWSAELRETPDKALLDGSLAKPEEVSAFMTMIEAMGAEPAALDNLDDESIFLYEELAESAMSGEKTFALPEPVEAAEDQDDLEALIKASTPEAVKA